VAIWHQSGRYGRLWKEQYKFRILIRDLSQLDLPEKKWEQKLSNAKFSFVFKKKSFVFTKVGGHTTTFVVGGIVGIYTALSK
jgi:hypothetical protein